MGADEIQALLRYHCQTIVAVIDDGGIKTSQIGILQATAKRIAELTNDLEGCPQEEDGARVVERRPLKKFKIGHPDNRSGSTADE